MVLWEEVSSISHVSLTCFLFLTSPIHCHSFAYVFSAIQAVSCTRALYPLSTCRNSSRNSRAGLKCHLLFNASLGPSPIKMYISLLSSTCTSTIITLHSASHYILKVTYLTSFLLDYMLSDVHHMPAFNFSSIPSTYQNDLHSINAPWVVTVN